MYGKHFAAMYRGSMVGSGAPVFAVWGYVIANMAPDEKVGAQVELNPVLLATILGEPEKTVKEAIDFLCQPDGKSRTPDEDGRRLVRVGQFDYRVVNGAKYIAIRNEEERRENNRIRVANHRAKKKETGIAKRRVRNGDPGFAGDPPRPSQCDDGGKPIQGSVKAHNESLERLAENGDGAQVQVPAAIEPPPMAPVMAKAAAVVAPETPRVIRGLVQPRTG